MLHLRGSEVESEDSHFAFGGVDPHIPNLADRSQRSGYLISLCRALLGYGAAVGCRWCQPVCRKPRDDLGPLVDGTYDRQCISEDMGPVQAQ